MNHTKNVKLSDVKGEVTFDNVFFGYSRDKTIIHDFSAVAKPGQKVALLDRLVLVRQPSLTLLNEFL